MITQEIIVDLQTNRNAFGLMHEDLRKAVTEIGFVNNFEMYFHDRQGPLWELITDQYMNFHKGSFFQRDRTYRLRADYQQESEIVECEIKPRNGILRYNHYALGWKCIAAVSDYHDFIGFKFESGDVCPYPIVYGLRGRLGYATTASVDDFKKEETFIDHATHVLFRKTL